MSVAATLPEERRTQSCRAGKGAKHRARAGFGAGTLRFARPTLDLYRPPATRSTVPVV